MNQLSNFNVTHIAATQLPYKLVVYDWKTNILIKKEHEQ